MEMEEGGAEYDVMYMLLTILVNGGGVKLFDTCTCTL